MIASAFLVPALIFAAIAAGAAVLVIRIYKRVKRTRDALLGSIDALGGLAAGLNGASVSGEAQEPRSVSGATSLYLPKIEEDFADFHYPEAVAAVKAFICEYLSVKYEGGRFSVSNVDPGVAATVDKLPEKHSVTDEAVHRTAICGYTKTEEYATITFRAAAGYKLDGRQTEDRYDIEYTLKLREEGIEQKSLICPRCGGAFTSTSEKVCPYCGSGIIRDTVMSWRFTSIRES